MSLSPRSALLLTLALALGGAGCATASQKEAAAPEAAPVVAMADKPAKQLHSGSFREAEKPVEGGFTIRREGQRTLLMLSEDFSTSRTAPDLKVTFGRAANPLSNSRPPAYPLQEGTYTVIAPLRAVSGAQTYELPADFDLADYGSLIIWCEQFNATMAWSPLNP